MQEKYEDGINVLPVEVVQQIAGYLKPNEAFHFALVTKQTFFNVKRNLTLNKKVHDISTLVAYGKQEEAQNLLAEFPNAQELLLTPVPFTDYSGRTFHCTAYEYAYWAKDTHMCRMLEQHMDENTKAQMLDRCEAIEKHGLKYRQNGKECCTHHFDFTPLKAALNSYVQEYGNWYNTFNWTAMEAAWMEVGRAQRDVPVYVVNEYCRKDRSFDPVPKFNEDKLPREFTFYNYKTGKDDVWFPLVVSDSSGLGVDVALIQGGGYEGSAVDGRAWRQSWACARGVVVDLAAIDRLDKVRTDDLMQSRENLMSAEPGIDNGFHFSLLAW